VKRLNITKENFKNDIQYHRNGSDTEFSSTTTLESNHNTIFLGLMKQIYLILLVKLNTVHKLINAMKLLKQKISLNMRASIANI